MMSVYEKLKRFWWSGFKWFHPDLHDLTYRYRIYIKYVFSGSMGAAANLFSLAFLVEIAHLYYLVASVLAVLIGYVTSFFLQKFFTFGYTSLTMVHRQMIVYFAISIMNIGINTALVYVCVDILGLWYLLSQLIASILIAIESFILYRRYVFIRQNQPPIS